MSIHVTITSTTARSRLCHCTQHLYSPLIVPRVMIICFPQCAFAEESVFRQLLSPNTKEHNPSITFQQEQDKKQAFVRKEKIKQNIYNTHIN
jgi:hypothetical protein